jgi:hypothetical protein
MTVKATREQILQAYGVLHQLQDDPSTGKYFKATLKECMDLLNSFQRARLYENDND